MEADVCAVLAELSTVLKAETSRTLPRVVLFPENTYTDIPEYEVPTPLTVTVKVVEVLAIA